MSEGSQIDWESHDNKVDEMLVELKDFNETINYVLDYAATRDDTLVIVSSDHETGGLDVIKQSGDDVVIGWTSGSHTLAPIGIFAYGPWTVSKNSNWCECVTSASPAYDNIITRLLYDIQSSSLVI